MRDLSRLAVGSTRTALVRLYQRYTRSGAHGRAITESGPPTVLLFYEDFERDRLVRGDRHARRALRRIYHAVTEGQNVTGFEVWFRSLCRALEERGCRVVVNNAALARRHPRHPVGICGYPHILDRWMLPNPSVLGPGLFDDPGQAPDLFSDARFRSYLVPCEWMRTFFERTYGDVCRIWYGGIDINEWPDYRGAGKDIDLLVYDKIRWNRESMVPELVTPVLDRLAHAGLRYHVIRYGQYTPEEYRGLLARSRAMLFLCEHETQGMAYQEALACNVPVLAWDQGVWFPPARKAAGEPPLPGSSVPYFSPACGERFTTLADFDEALARILSRLAAYEPRRYVSDWLSHERSARLYLEAYAAAAPETAAAR